MDALRAYLKHPDHSQKALAEAIGLTQPAIAKWIKRNRIPAEQVLPVSRVTGIAPEKLRPDLFRRTKAA